MGETQPVRKVGLFLLGLLGVAGLLVGIDSVAQHENAPHPAAPTLVVEPDIAKFIASRLSDQAWLRGGSVDREHIVYLTFTPAAEALTLFRLKNNKAAWVATINGSRRRTLAPQLFGGVRETCRREGPALTTTYFKIESGPVVGSVLQFQEFRDGDRQAVLTNAAYLGAGNIDSVTRRCVE